MEHGVAFYDYVGQDPRLNNLFNDAMASDARLVSTMVIEKCEGVFKGLESLVDVGGGTGTMAKAIAKSFPQLDCIVFDLPHVVAGLQGGYDNLKYVGGNMFEAIPPTNSILLEVKYFEIPICSFLLDYLGFPNELRYIFFTISCAIICIISCNCLDFI
ncbi:hypothetical protein TanjilG_29205 [Lupinus angustifolius]|uniref:O-methyltransferase C-terminal domain-containing protein n=1 Tax=Lupinus angustifolius TaxID=3871 RepID=A0A394DG68_LUPAN|nr:hypothetical protein TanjilG_29205 [Lupinus angustifolius]